MIALLTHSEFKLGLMLTAKFLGVSLGWIGFMIVWDRPKANELIADSTTRKES